MGAEASGVTASDIVATLASDMPKPTAPAATAAAKPEPKKPAAPMSAEKDVHGRAFDPLKFKPEKDKLGRWKNLNAGRKSPAAKPIAETQPESQPAASIKSYIAPDAPSPRAPDEYEAAAQTIIGLYQGGLVMLGEEEGILTDSERAAIAEPLEQVLRKYDAGKMPPELSLALVAGSIFLSRAAKPKTQTKIQKIRHWFREKAMQWRGGRVARHVERVAPVQTPQPPQPDAEGNS